MQLSMVVLLALAVRIVVVFLVVHDSSHKVTDNNFGWESWEMGWTARSIFLGKGFSSPFLPQTGPTALVPPLYPYLIALSFKAFGFWTTSAAAAVLSFNAICSSLTCIPLFLLVRNAVNARIGRIVALAWAIYPFAIYFSATRVWDYALTSLLFTTCLLFAEGLHKRSSPAWLCFGLLYGVTVLSNPSVTTLLPVLLILAIRKIRSAHAPWLMKGTLAIVGFVVVCTPWQIRNYRVMHACFFIRDGFALEAYAGNNGDTSASNSAFVHPASNPAEMEKFQNMGEIAYMQEKHDLLVNFVTHHPGFVALATLRRIVRFWTGYWSFSPQYLKYDPFDLPNVPFCLFLCTFLYKGIKNLTKQERSALLPYLLALAIFPLPYYFTHSSMDYRQPVEPIVILLVSIGLFGTAPARETATTVASQEDVDENLLLA